MTTAIAERMTQEERSEKSRQLILDAALKLFSHKGYGATSVRDIINDYREYIALIYVDVVEFDGTHVRKFYADMADRFDAFIKAHGLEEKLRSRLADGLSPVSAVMLATRIFYNYFTVEILFGVRDHFGKGTDAVVAEIATILRNGMLKA